MLIKNGFKKYRNTSHCTYCHPIHDIKKMGVYTLSHSENDRDVTEPKDTRCKTRPLCVKPGVPFWTREKTHKLRARWQASSSGIRADITVVLEVRESIQKCFLGPIHSSSVWWNKSHHILPYTECNPPCTWRTSGTLYHVSCDQTKWGGTR